MSLSVEQFKLKQSSEVIQFCHGKLYRKLDQSKVVYQEFQFTEYQTRPYGLIHNDEVLVFLDTISEYNTFSEQNEKTYLFFRPFGANFIQVSFLYGKYFIEL